MSKSHAAGRMPALGELRSSQCKRCVQGFVENGLVHRNVSTQAQPASFVIDSVGIGHCVEARRCCRFQTWTQHHGPPIPTPTLLVAGRQVPRATQLLCTIRLRPTMDLNELEHIEEPDAQPLVAPAFPPEIEGIDLSSDLVGAYLGNADLAGADLSGRDLTGADLAGADLSEAKLNGACLRDANLVEAKLEETQLLGADLSGADLTSAHAFSAMFGRSDLTNAVLFNANLDDATLSHADLTGADLRTARLEGARLRDATLSGADFSRAEMVGVDLTGAKVDQTLFRDTDLSRSRVKSVTGASKADWIGVDILDTDFAGAYMVRRAIMDQNYLYEFRTKNPLNGLIYKIWLLTSDCGRSFARCVLLTGVIAALFAIAYSFVEIDYGDYETWLSPMYYSVVTMTTLGYGDAVPASMSGQMVAMVEVLSGYVMLGGVLSIFATKMGRRAE